MMVRESYTEENRSQFLTRWLYDLSSFIIINIIVLNSVFGQIIDAFSRLRRLNEEIDYQRENTCFTCCLHRNRVIFSCFFLQISLKTLGKALSRISRSIIIAGTICTTSTTSSTNQRPSIQESNQKFFRKQTRTTSLGSQITKLQVFQKSKILWKKIYSKRCLRA